MWCVTVNIVWKLLHCRWTVVLQFEWSVLQLTLCGRYCTAGGQWYYSLDGVCYSEHCVEVTALQVDSGITVWLECVTVNIVWMILHSRWTVVLKFGWSVLQWTLCGWYCTAGGPWYCSLDGVCYSEHYVVDTALQLDSGISVWMECVTVNIVWKVLHCRWTVVLQFEWNPLQWELCEIMDNKFTTKASILFRVFLFTLLFSLLVFVIKNKWLFTTNSEIYNINTRYNSNFYLSSTNLTLVQKGVHYSGSKVFNHLPENIKGFSQDLRHFKSVLRSFLDENTFYSLEEYYQFTVNWSWLILFLVFLIFKLSVSPSGFLDYF